MIAQAPRTPAEARRSHLESEAWRRLLVWGLRTVPPSVRRVSMPLWSAFFYAQVPHVRRGIERNLARLLGLRAPRLQLAAFRTFTNYCRCVANAYCLHAGLPLRVRAAIPELTALRDALRAGRGAVLATGHLGNWHLGPYLLGQHGLPPLTVVMHQEPDAGAQRLEETLRDQRMRVLYSGQSPLIGLELRAALGRGELVGLQMDRPSLGGGQRVWCAGGQALFARGPALLARTCDAPVVPVFFPLDGAGVRILVEPPLWSRQSADRDADLTELTARLAAIYARCVYQHPDQWFNFYDFWSPEASTSRDR
jgi:Kdo2-lipid IVA lauroyltransferase/acyltransferase